MSRREEILRRTSRTSTTVDVPEWECKVEFRSLKAKDRADLIVRYSDDDGALNISALMPELLVLTAYDPDSGERIFAPDDCDAIGEMDGVLIERLAKDAAIISGLYAGAVDDAGKGSSTTPTSDSGSSSPGNSDPR